MKSNLLRLYLLCFFLVSDFVAFADPIPPDEGGDPAAPIDGKLVWLAIAAVIFAFYSYKRKVTVA